MNAREQHARPWERWIGGVAVGLLTLVLYLAGAGPIDATVPFVVLTGLAVAAALPAAWRVLSTTPALATASRVWPFLAYGLALTIAWAATPTSASTAEIQRQALFLSLVGATARVAEGRVGRLLVLVQFAGLLLVLLQIPGPRSGIDHLGRAGFYHALEQWSGYPELGLLMGAGASGAMAIALAARGVIARIAAAVLAVAFTGATLFLQSRSALLTIPIVAIWLAAVAVVKWRARVAALAVMAVVAAGLWLATTGPGLSGVFERAASAVARETAIRQAGWDAALLMAREHPLTGVGLGRYKPEYQQRDLGPDASHAYNILLHVVAESGLVGLIGWLALWGHALWGSLWRASRTPTGVATFAVHAMLAAFLVRSQSEHFLANLDTSFRMLLLMGIWIGLAEGLGRTPPPLDRPAVPEGGPASWNGTSGPA